jgi:protein SCO1/2
MSDPQKSLRFLIVSGFGLLVFATVLLVLQNQRQKSLVHGSPGSPAPTGGEMPVISMLSDFALTNHAGAIVRRSDLLGTVLVGDIIFTRCPGPCARMSANLSRLQRALEPAEPVRFFSLTADPDFDTPAVLAEYARRHGAELPRWQFLTGTKADLYRLATRDLLLVVVDNTADTNAPPEDLFLHSTKLVVLDRGGRLRATFDGEDPAVIPQVVAAVRQLASETRLP